MSSFSLFSEPSNQSNTRGHVQNIQRRSNIQVRSINQKRALIIGLNYFSLPIPLSNCLNDSQIIMESIKLGAYFTNVKLINDLPNKVILKQDILNGIHWLVNDSEKGDILYFHFSGKSKNNAIYLNDNEEITNEELRNIIFDILPHGVTLLMTFDSLYKGYGLRYLHSNKKNYELTTIPDTESCCIIISSYKRDDTFIQLLKSSFTDKTHTFQLKQFEDIAKLEFGQVIDILVPMSRIIGSPI